MRFVPKFYIEKQVFFNCQNTPNIKTKILILLDRLRNLTGNFIETLAKLHQCFTWNFNDYFTWSFRTLGAPGEGFAQSLFPKRFFFFCLKVWGTPFFCFNIWWILFLWRWSARRVAFSGASHTTVYTSIGLIWYQFYMFQILLCSELREFAA